MTADQDDLEQTESLPPIALGRHGGIAIVQEDRTVAFISDRRLYLNADKTAVVEEGDPAAAWLLVGEGGEVSTSVARQFGLKAPAKQPPDTSAPDTREPGDAESLGTIEQGQKAVAGAPANKAIAPKADK